MAIEKALAIAGAFGQKSTPDKNILSFFLSDNFRISCCAYCFCMGQLLWCPLTWHFICQCFFVISFIYILNMYYYNKAMRNACFFRSGQASTADRQWRVWWVVSCHATVCSATPSTPPHAWRVTAPLEGYTVAQQRTSENVTYFTKR